MKKICSFVLLIMVVFLLGCNSYDETTPATESKIPTEIEQTEKPLLDGIVFENELYKIEREQGECYISLKVGVDELAPTKTLSSSESLVSVQMLYSAPSFDSMEELIDAAIVTGFTKEQIGGLLDVVYFCNPRLEIFDFENMKRLTIPEELEMGKITLRGSGLCEIELKPTDSTLKSSTAYIYLEDSYKKNFEAYTKLIPSETMVSDDPNDVYYVDTDGKKIKKYSFDAGSISYIVFNHYSVFDKDNKYPQQVVIYGGSEDLFFKVEVNIKEAVAPHVDWISSFAFAE